MVYPSLISAVKDIDFPIDKKSLINQVGNREIEVLEGQSIAMKELLNACPHNRYDNPQDVVRCPEIVDKILKAA